MPIPLHIVFRDIPKSDAIEAEIRRRADKLEQFSDHIMRCQVTVGIAGKHKTQGSPFEVFIDITLPGAEIAVGKNKHQEDLHVAIHDAFDAVTRKLQDHIERRRG